MGNPVVHFEIIGTDPQALRAFYGELFGWEYDTSGRVADEVSVPDDYGFVEPDSQPGTGAGNIGIPGGIGGGPGYPAHAVFYVAVPDVEAALQKAERLGGTRRLGPAEAPTGLVVGQFTDPEGNLVGLAAVPQQS